MIKITDRTTPLELEKFHLSRFSSPAAQMEYIQSLKFDDISLETIDYITKFYTDMRKQYKPEELVTSTMMQMADILTELARDLTAEMMANGKVSVHTMYKLALLSDDEYLQCLSIHNEQYDRLLVLSKKADVLRNTLNP